MVIGAMIRQRARERGREEGRAEGREEGRHEIHQLWMEWNQRRIDAEDRGEPFTETPTPDQRSESGCLAVDRRRHPGRGRHR